MFNYFINMGRRRIRLAESVSQDSLNLTSPATSPTMARKSYRDDSTPSPSPDCATDSDDSSAKEVRLRRGTSHQPCPMYNRIISKHDRPVSVSLGNDRNAKTTNKPVDGCGDAEMDPQNEFFGCSLYKEITPKLLRVLEPRTKFDAQPCIVRGLRFNSKGDLLISDSSNKKVKVFDNNDRLKVECSVPDSYGSFEEPAGLCQLKSGEIIVADRHAGDIKAFTSEGMLLTKFGRGLRRPRDVCTNSLGHLIVVDEGLSDVLLYRSLSDKGAIHLNKRNGEAERYLLSPCNVTTVRDDCIVATDDRSNVAVLFDSFGNHVTKIPNLQVRSHSQPELFCRQGDHGKNCECEVHPVTSDLMKQPLGICNDRNNATLVADYGNSRVIRLDLRKNCISGVLLGNDQITKPLAVASHPSGLLAVLEQDVNKIKIFRYLEQLWLMTVITPVDNRAGAQITVKIHVEIYVG